jgi:hypothetical protein
VADLLDGMPEGWGTTFRTATGSIEFARDDRSILLTWTDFDGWTAAIRGADERYEIRKMHPMPPCADFVDALHYGRLWLVEHHHLFDLRSWP